MLALKHFTLLFTLVGSFVGSSHGQLLTPPLLPSVDPFYAPPSGFEDETPGTILRTRKIASAYFGLIPNPVAAWQILYRSTAINGSAIADATTVFKPTNAKKDRFVSFHTAYDGSARSGVCDPSYNYRLLAPQIDLISSVEFLLLQAFVKEGNIVSSPDYEGPDSAFGAGRLSGMGVLDSMRAVASFSSLEFDSDNPAVVGYGYSGGGIATGWAASLQQTYAPEIAIKGWASGGTPANLTGTAQYLDGTAFSGFLPQALIGVSAPSAYGAELIPVYNEILTPYGRSQLDAARDICGVENLFTFQFQSIQTTQVQTLGAQVLYDSRIAEVLARNIMGQTANETPTVPVYLYHGLHDEVIPYANATTLRDEWCGYGASVQFVTFANGGHATTEVLGFPGAFDFVNAAFDGTVASGCSEKTLVDDTVQPLALGVSLEPIIVDLLNGLAIAGQKDAKIIEDPSQMNKTVTDNDS